MTEKANHGASPGAAGRKLPPWLKRPAPSGADYDRVVKLLRQLELNTVCDGAGCPNRGECYSQGTATFMIMGDVCTRNCRFCRVSHGEPGPLGPDEPARLAQAVKELGLRHVVITSVTRDDLADGGAEHFAAVIAAVRKAAADVTIEILTPDFLGEATSLDVICAAHPDVFNHNIETSRRLTGEIRSGADYQRSLQVLQYVGEHDGAGLTKSGFMLGLGETQDEIAEMLTDLRGAGVSMVTIGQYLRPSKDNRTVARFYTPEEFGVIAQQGQEMGFAHVACGPFVRSSYHADINLQQRNRG